MTFVVNWTVLIDLFKILSRPDEILKSCDDELPIGEMLSISISICDDRFDDETTNKASSLFISFQKDEFLQYYSTYHQKSLRDMISVGVMMKFQK
jgi:hypothetical protein